MKKSILLVIFSILFLTLGQNSFAATSLPSEIELMDRKDVIDYILYTIVFAVAVATALVVLWFLFKRKGKQK